MVALLVAAAPRGRCVHVAVSRPLRTAPVLAKVVAAVGIMLTLQAAVSLKYGTDARSLDVMLPDGTVKIGGANVAVDRLWLIGIVVVLGCDPGDLVPAVADRPGHPGGGGERAGGVVRPAVAADRSALITWVLATVFTAFILIIAGPATGVLSPGNLTLLVVPALAAALIARLSSLWIALVGALALGVVQSELQFLSQHQDVVAGVGEAGADRRRAVRRDRGHAVRARAARSRCAARTPARACRR